MCMRVYVCACVWAAASNADCHYSCKTCAQAGKCLECKDRLWELDEASSLCLCQSGYFEDVQLRECRKCFSTCKRCRDARADQCLSCWNNLQLRGGECVCSATQLLDAPQNQCLQLYEFFLTAQLFQEPEIILEVRFNQRILNESYFGQRLPDFMSANLSQFFSISIQNLEKNVQYTVKLYDLSAYALRFIVLPTTSFPQVELRLDVLQKQRITDIYGQQLKSDQQTKFTFLVGPRMQLDRNDAKQIEQIRLLSNQYINGNGLFIRLLRILKYIQFITYLLNSIQPVAALLLINIVIPVNAYEIIKILALMIFSSIPSWEQDKAFTPTIFGKRVPFQEEEQAAWGDQGTEGRSAQRGNALPFRIARIQLATNLFYNCSQCLLIISFIWALLLLAKRKLKQSMRARRISYHQLEEYPSIYSFIYFQLFNVLVKVHEAQFLLITISLMI